eukprot:TRINITY_DN75487_c0_g1_i1.p1 TRINITY_DN75487_c0_g1~~TRINITY_DN75487_c0_g1_i1.p1  ORF type:complete len:310 (+),score=79.37 TRINITY_DN75487_c0_g1_i1:103-930(+)
MAGAIAGSALLTPASGGRGATAAAAAAGTAMSRLLPRSRAPPRPRRPPPALLRRSAGGPPPSGSSSPIIAALRAPGSSGPLLSAQRGALHIPALAWLGGAKLGAIVGALAANKHVTSALNKWLQQVGVKGVLRSIRDMNGTLLAAGVHHQPAHDAVERSLRALEARLASVGQDERVQVLQKWLGDLETMAPELAVALAKAYVDTFSPVRLAKSLLKGALDEASSSAGGSNASAAAAEEELVAGLRPQEWEKRIRKEFPQLKDYDISFVPRKSSRP